MRDSGDGHGGLLSWCARRPCGRQVVRLQGGHQRWPVRVL